MSTFGGFAGVTGGPATGWSPLTIRNHPRFKAMLQRMGLDYWAANP